VSSFKKNRFLSATGLLALGLVLGFGAAQLGTAAAGSATIQEVTPASYSAAAPALDEQIPQGAFVEVAERAQPAVVYIQAQHEMRPEDAQQGMMPDIFRRFFPDDVPEDQMPQMEPEEVPSQGSGFIIRPTGYILTNAHVVSRILGDRDEVETVRAKEITVRLSDEEEYDAEIVGLDIGTDVAVLKINAGEDLPFLPLGDSDAARVGEWVMALGAPFGLTNTVSAGIISAKGRAQLNLQANFYQDFIQTDAAINPGNSGGPLVNLKGEVIGMNTAIVSNGFQQQFSGVGFASPMNLVGKVAEQLIAHGRVIRGWVGVTITPLSEDLAEGFGVADMDLDGAVVLQEVNPGEPAEQAGLRAGDIVVAMDGSKLDGNQDFLQRIAIVPPGETITLDVLRAGESGLEESTVTVALGERPSEEEIYRRNLGGARRGREEAPEETTTADSVSRAVGLIVTDLTEELAEQIGYEDEIRGVVVMQVARGSAAADALLGRGDLILEVKGEPVANIAEFEEALSEFGPDEVALLRVRRTNGQYAFVPLRMPEE
jgi:serine protease Do